MKLLPIERGPGGSLPRMTAAQRKRANALIRNTCCNYESGLCLLLDERTPHMHLTFVPLTKDNRLCAKEILGNRASLSRWQDDFHAYMVKSFPDLERGESSRQTGRRHIPTRLFKQAVSLSKQAAVIEKTLDSINVMNAGKKDENKKICSDVYESAF